MAFYPNGQTGGKGHARVKRQDEARNLYQYLTTSVIDGRRLQVHLWDIGGTTANFLRCNCESPTAHNTQANPTQSAEISRIAMASGWRMISAPQASQTAIAPVQYPIAPAANYAPPPAAQLSITQAQLISAMANMGLSQQDPRFYQYATTYAAQYAQILPSQSSPTHVFPAQASQAQAGASRSSAAYTTTSSSLPVNARNGTVRTEVRGVFVSGLSYQARLKDVQALFSKAGELSKCEMQKDAATGRFKGKATIKYATAAGAAQAISMLDGRTWLGMELKVRADTETTPVSPPPSAQASRTSQPVIVNGSQVC
ncbi:hypothetical protein LTR78_002972 [Recurvomyces mirabilis]|uniref:RRM domain-containing protein n=1 Tax=Recurvomyces mirabilis TaxID=574656 RepID=A0AAE0WSU0_9PEZI|nr:hypothetical protein LTR78_002972 [Recurvomyces mirabilis]KAK5159295.1 hypothetical protein LTS14_002437 [Recurvomyces mirabilis]